MILVDPELSLISTERVSQDKTEMFPMLNSLEDFMLINGLEKESPSPLFREKCSGLVISKIVFPNTKCIYYRYDQKFGFHKTSFVSI